MIEFVITLIITIALWKFIILPVAKSLSHNKTSTEENISNYFGDDSSWFEFN